MDKGDVRLMRIKLCCVVLGGALLGLAGEGQMTMRFSASFGIAFGGRSWAKGKARRRRHISSVLFYFSTVRIIVTAMVESLVGHLGSSCCSGIRNSGQCYKILHRAIPRYIFLILF